MPVRSGGQISFAQSLETVREDLLQVRPTLFLSVPRLYEKVYSAILKQRGCFIFKETSV
jgi:long-chain acyl-CoA synthetase